MNKDLILSGIINCTNDNSHILPIQALGPHVTALGMRFYKYNEYNASYGSIYPSKYNNSIFIAQRGSFSRSDKVGYRISMVSLTDDDDSGTNGVSVSVSEHSIFAEGWLDLSDDSYWGRPVDLEFMIDGSMIISDDTESVLYRIYYNSSVISNQTGVSNGNNENVVCNYSYATDINDDINGADTGGSA